MGIDTGIQTAVEVWILDPLTDLANMIEGSELSADESANVFKMALAGCRVRMGTIMANHALKEA